jgi:hypothetical protein
MAKEWTDEEVQAEIREAVRIVHEDRERATYQQLHERFGQKPSPSGDPKDGKNPPPPKDGGDQPPTQKRKSLWWGERLEGE